MEITFEKKKKIVAKYEGHTVVTDLSIEAGGEDTALNPFQLFLTALCSCTALFMRIFYEKHDLSIEEAKLDTSFDYDADGNVKQVNMIVHVGKDFPMEKKDALILNMKSCKVRKHVDPRIIFNYKVVE